MLKLWVLYGMGTSYVSKGNGLGLKLYDYPKRQAGNLENILLGTLCLTANVRCRMSLGPSSRPILRKTYHLNLLRSYHRHTDISSAGIPPATMTVALPRELANKTSSSSVIHYGRCRHQSCKVEKISAHMRKAIYTYNDTMWPLTYLTL